MATTRIVVLLNLRPGVDRAAYEAWARSSDLPTVNSLGSVDGFGVLRTTGVLGGSGPAPYEYIEIIDINDMERFGADVQSEAMKALAALRLLLVGADFGLHPEEHVGSVAQERVGDG